MTDEIEMDAAASLGGEEDEDNHEAVVGKFLVAMVRIEGRVERVIQTHAGIPDDRTDFFEDMFLERLMMGRKIELFTRVLEDVGLREEFAWLLAELRNLNETRNYLAHDLPHGSATVIMGTDNLPAQVIVDRGSLHFMRKKKGKRTSVAIPIKEQWERLNKVCAGVLDVWDRIRSEKTS